MQLSDELGVSIHASGWATSVQSELGVYFGPSANKEMTYAKVLSVIALVVSVGWAIAAPGFEPVLAVVVSLSALVSTFVIERRSARLRQRQAVSGSSVGVQAGGDVIIGAPDSRNDIK
jgi:hypothetical protein